MLRKFIILRQGDLQLSSKEPLFIKRYFVRDIDNSSTHILKGIAAKPAMEMAFIVQDSAEYNLNILIKNNYIKILLGGFNDQCQHKIIKLKHSSIGKDNIFDAFYINFYIVKRGLRINVNTSIKIILINDEHVLVRNNVIYKQVRSVAKHNNDASLYNEVTFINASISGQINIQYRALLFGNSQAIIIPQFPILPGSLIAEHGVAIYTIEPKQKFYLETRHISQQQLVMLLNI